jgi:beta-ring hydroxylase
VPAFSSHLPAQVDEVVGDRAVTVEDMRNLRYTTRVINESMRLYPQPPVLIRRALEDDYFDEIKVQAWVKLPAACLQLCPPGSLHSSLCGLMPHWCVAPLWLHPHFRQVAKGSDVFISVWNLHHSGQLWKDPEAFNPDRCVQQWLSLCARKHRVLVVTPSCLVLL